MLWTFSSSALADEQKIRDLIKEKFPNVELEQVNKVKGIELYEIVFDGDLVYVDSNLKYFIDGNLRNTATSNLKTVCANCQRLQGVRRLGWRVGDLVADN